MRLLSLPLALILLLWPATSSAQQLEAKTPEELGIHSQGLHEMSEWVRRMQLDIRSMVLLRQGNVAFEWYAGGVTRDHNHNIFSVTKSVVATLTGAAIKEEKLAGTDLTLAALFPESASLRTDPRKAGITLADLLTMRSGLPNARANVTGPRRDLFYKIHNAADRTKMILELPMEGEPVEEFIYGNAEPQLVAAILEKAFDQRMQSLADETLFEPLDFKNAD